MAPMHPFSTHRPEGLNSIFLLDSNSYDFLLKVTRSLVLLSVSSSEDDRSSKSRVDKDTSLRMSSCCSTSVSFEVYKFSLLFVCFNFLLSCCSYLKFSSQRISTVFLLTSNTIPPFFQGLLFKDCIFLFSFLFLFLF